MVKKHATPREQDRSAVGEYYALKRQLGLTKEETKNFEKAYKLNKKLEYMRAKLHFKYKIDT